MTTYPDESFPDEEGLSYQEKSTIVSLLTTIIVFVIYCIVVIGRYQVGTFGVEAEIRFWAAATLILVPVQVAAQIILQIVFTIISFIATREEPPTLSDELDHLIELKSLRVAYFAFLIGFFLAIGAVVINLPVVTMFIMLFFWLILAGIIGDIAKLYFYRRGF